MNIKTVDKRSGNHICDACRGLVLSEGQKAANFAENFVICRCHSAAQKQKNQNSPELNVDVWASQTFD